jgi:Fe2+ or Zn2+ uptake regulation protein
MKTFENEVAERLHGRGGRMTPQRRLILDALNCLGGHPNAEQIFDLARQRDPGLNLSTVYRTLRWLEQEGLVSARHFDETGRHDHFDPALPAQHYHFVCKVCERVIEFDDPAFETVKSKFELLNKVTVETVSVMFYGVCQACNKPGL